MFCKLLASRRRRAIQQSFRKLMLEALEDRLTPSGYSLTDLGAWQIPQAGSGFFSDEVVNDAGQVILNNSKGQAFLYSNGQLTNLGSLPGDNYTEALGINNSGQIVGRASSSSNLTAQPHAFLYSDGHMTDLNSLVSSGPAGLLLDSAVAINDNGQIAGHFLEYNNKGFVILSQAYLYTNGTVTALGGLNSTSEFSLANGINASGQVVGSADSPDSTLVQNGFLYSNGQLTDLGTLIPVGIDNSGQVLLPLGGFYSNGQKTDLGAPPGYTAFLGSAINNSGQIVGFAGNSSGSGVALFLYSNGTWTNLSNQLPSGFTDTLTNIVGISDNGKIVAAGANGHLYLLTQGNAPPPPPPGSPPPSAPISPSPAPSSVPPPPPQDLTNNGVLQAVFQSGPQLDALLATGINAAQEVADPAAETLFSVTNPFNPTYQIPALQQLLAMQNSSEANALYSDFANWMYWAWQGAATAALDFANNVGIDPQVASSLITNTQYYIQQLQQNPLASTPLGMSLIALQGLD